MAEALVALGGAAAVTQLVHYGYKFATATSALSHNVRHAHERIQAWVDQSITITLLLDDAQHRVRYLGASTLQLLEQCRQDAEQLRFLLRPFSVSLPVQKATKLTERTFVVRKEAEIEQLFSSFRSKFNNLAVVISLNLIGPLLQTSISKSRAGYGQSSTQFSVHHFRQGCTSRNVLTTMSFFHDSAVHTSLLAKIFDRASLSNAISDLVSRSLIRRIPNTRTIELIPYVREIVQSEIKALPEQLRSLTLALKALNAAFCAQFAQPRTLSRSHSFRPHVSIVLNAAMDLPPCESVVGEATILAVQYCMYLLTIGNYASVKELILAVRVWCQDYLASDSDATIALDGKEAAAHTYDGSLNSALQLYRKMHRSRAIILGKSDIRTLYSMNGMGLVYHAWGDYTKAKSCHHKVLAYKTKLLGANDPDTLVSANNLGIVLQSEGNYAAAEELFSRSLRGWLQVYDSDDLFVIAARSNLGIALHFQGRLDEAENLHRYAFKERRRILGDTHHETTKSKANLAITMNESGHHAEAETLYREALGTFEDTLGSSHPDTLKTRTNLATAIHDQGNYEEAESIVAAAIPLIRMKYGSKHGETLEAMEFRAILLHNLDEYSVGLRVAFNVYKIRRELLGYNHDDTQRSLQHVRDLAENCEVTQTMSLFSTPGSMAVY